MRDSIRVVNIRERLGHIEQFWSPRIAGQVNDVQVKLVKLSGEFEWHHHDVEDELFLVVHGRLLMQFRDRELWVEEGEFLIVPHGVEHRPVAPQETHIVLIEPAGTLNTGTTVSERTVHALEWI